MRIKFTVYPDKKSWNNEVFKEYTVVSKGNNLERDSGELEGRLKLECWNFVEDFLHLFKEVK